MKTMVFPLTLISHNEVIRVKLPNKTNALKGLFTEYLWQGSLMLICSPFMCQDYWLIVSYKKVVKHVSDTQNQYL